MKKGLNKIETGSSKKRYRRKVRQGGRGRERETRSVTDRQGERHEDREKKDEGENQDRQTERQTDMSTY